jgi:hypothetical protein
VVISGHLHTIEPNKLRWSMPRLRCFAQQWYVSMRRQQRTAHEDRPWWFFAHAWPKQVTGWLTAFQRALDKVTALSPNAVYPATFQRTLVRWATWWPTVLGGDQQILLGGWTRYCIKYRFNPGFVAVSMSLMLDKEFLSA